MSPVESGLSRDLEMQSLRSLFEILSRLARAQSIEEACEASLLLIVPTIADRAAVLIFDAAGQVRVRAGRALSENFLSQLQPGPWASGASDGEPVSIEDTPHAAQSAADRDALAREGIGSLLRVPLQSSRGVFGEFLLFSNEPHDWTSDEMALAQQMADYLNSVLEWRRAQAESSDEHLAAVVENSFDAIITKDLNGIITSWNQAAEDLLGYTAAEAVGQSVSMITPEGRVAEMRMIVDRISQGEHVKNHETQRKTKDGKLIDVSLTVSPVRDHEGHIIGASKILRDISDRKRAEKERSVLLARAEEARTTAELLNQVGPTLLAERDPERLVQVITDMATALVSAEAGCFFRQSVNFKGESCMYYRPARASRDAFADFEALLNLGLLATVIRGEGVFRCPDAHQLPWSTLGGPHSPRSRPQADRSYLAAPVVSRSGEVLGGLFFAHSAVGWFSDRHEALLKGVAAQSAIAMDNARLFEQAEWAQNELQRSNEELRRINEDLEAFAYSASHDLQEPLRTITLSSELLQRAFGGQLQGEAGGFLGNILHSSRTMAQLIQDLLAYTTATRAAEGPPPVADSNAVLAQVVQNLKSAIDSAGATISSEALPSAFMHESRLAQLLQNLIGNALKYRGAKPPHVHVSGQEKDGWTVFSVEDNGIGIAPEYVQQIFGLFKRLHSGAEYSGSGLGLAICQRVVEQYAGRIWVENSELGRGSTFCFAVPARDPRPLSPPQPR